MPDTVIRDNGVPITNPRDTRVNNKLKAANDRIHTQYPLSSPESTALLAHNSVITQPLVELSERNVNRNGYCRGGTTYNSARSIHKQIQINASHLLTLVFVIIMISLQQSGSIHIHSCGGQCQIDTGNNKHVLLRQRNKCIKYSDIKPIDNMEEMALKQKLSR